MNYIKDRFLNYAYRLTEVGYYYEEDAKRKQQQESLGNILEKYRQEPKLADWLLCKRIAELAEAGTVHDQVITGRWRQLTAILDLYKQRKIADIGLSANITQYQKNDKGATISSRSLFVHDRGESKLEFQGQNALREEVKNILASIDSELPREQFFNAITETIKNQGSEKTAFTVEISEYLFIDGEEDSSLLRLSPNSFCQEDYHADQDERPEEYQHFHDQLKELTVEQLHELIKNCGLEDEAVKEMVQFDNSQNDSSALEDLKSILWSADREDFYRSLRAAAKNEEGAE